MSRSKESPYAARAWPSIRSTLSSGASRESTSFQPDVDSLLAPLDSVERILGHALAAYDGLQHTVSQRTAIEHTVQKGSAGADLLGADGSHDSLQCPSVPGQAACFIGLRVVQAFAGKYPGKATPGYLLSPEGRICSGLTEAMTVSITSEGSRRRSLRWSM